MQAAREHLPGPHLTFPEFHFQPLFWFREMVFKARPYFRARCPLKQLSQGERDQVVGKRRVTLAVTFGQVPSHGPREHVSEPAKPDPQRGTSGKSPTRLTTGHVALTHGALPKDGRRFKDQNSGDRWETPTGIPA